MEEALAFAAARSRVALGCFVEGRTVLVSFAKRCRALKDPRSNKSKARRSAMAQVRAALAGHDPLSQGVR